MEKYLEYNKNSDRVYFYVPSDELKEAILYINDNNIVNIKLNRYKKGKKYLLDNIDWIGDIPNIKVLEMGGCRNINFSGIEQLSKLERLILPTTDGEEVNLGNLIDLKQFLWTYENNVIGFSNLHNIESLSLFNGDKNVLNKGVFSNFSKLSSLSLNSSKLLNSLRFLENNKKIVNLEIFNTKDSINLKDLLVIKKSIKKLKIKKCNKIENIESLSCLSNLEKLSIIDSIKLPNIDLLYKLDKLNDLTILGTSFFEDGNLSLLLNRYKHLSIDNKRHYNIKYDKKAGEFLLKD